MTIRAEHFRTQVLREPWKVMTLAAAAGECLMAALIAALTLLLLASSGTP